VAILQLEPAVQHFGGLIEPRLDAVVDVLLEVCTVLDDRSRAYASLGLNGRRCLQGGESEQEGNREHDDQLVGGTVADRPLQAIGSMPVAHRTFEAVYGYSARNLIASLPSRVPQNTRERSDEATDGDRTAHPAWPALHGHRCVFLQRDESAR